MMDFYGDSIRWFMGVVEEAASDEPKLGRVRVRIYGVHGSRAEVPVSDLPYAQVLVPTTEPGISGLGRNPMLSEGATVFGIFLDGKNSQLPLVLGSIPVIEVPSSEQINSESNDPDFSDSIKKSQGTNIPGTPGSGTGGVAGMKSVTYAGFDGYTYDPDNKVGSNIQIAWDWFNKTGKYSHAVIAGILGNLIVESGTGSPIDISTKAKGDNGNSIGIAQWYNGTNRQEKLKEHAEKRGKDIEDLFVQLEFIDIELTTDPYYKGQELKTKKTPTEAAIHFQRNYERPAFVDSISPIDGQRMRLHEDRRIAYAKQVYNLFTRKVI